MKEQIPILKFDDDSIIGALFSFADIPEFWNEGDYIANLDIYDILDTLHNSA